MVDQLQLRLVSKVKALQRQEAFSKSWDSFSKASNLLKDPGRCPPRFLLSWLESVEEVPDDLQVLLQKAKAQLEETTKQLEQNTKQRLVVQGEDRTLMKRKHHGLPKKQSHKGALPPMLSISKLYTAARTGSLTHGYHFS
ncbi:unnamed protein product [Durusdinium trenchii]|eukprot:g33708.t1